jgi:UDP-N-acetylmuramoylalanine--D-glutamate ligase
MNSHGKNVLILGLAREGASLACYLARQGARVTVTDSAPREQLRDRVRSLSGMGIRFFLGDHHPELLENAELFFVSPGVPEQNPICQAACKAGLPIHSMTTLFFELCPGRIAGITGSSGKTTTTGLLAHILRQAEVDTAVGGNIGDPMLDLLPRIGPSTTVVLELSSFQLRILQRSPQIAVVTNITPNHLDRHGDMAHYIAAKRQIVQHQSPGDFAVLNANDTEVRKFAEVTPAEIRWFGYDLGTMRGATVLSGRVGIQAERFSPVMAVSDVPLLGRHNVENVLAALAAADVLGVPSSRIAAAVQTYRPAPHRLETIAEYAGVRYIDDSIATSPARASVALQALDAPVLLIAGGRDKKLPWDELAQLITQKVRALFLIGEAAPTIEDAVRRYLTKRSLLRGEAIVRCPSLCEAVAQARRLATAGNVVLLSPGCASYDMFTDFEERGQMFAQAVEALDAA